MQNTFILFDVDGTLVYSNKIDSRSFAETYQLIYKKAFPSIDWRTYPHVTDHTIFSTVIAEHFSRKVEPEEIEHFQDQFVGLLETKRKAAPDDFKEVPGASRVVKQLQAEGYRVGIGTGGWERPARLKLRHVGIAEESLIVSAADNKVAREEIIQQAIDQARQRYGNIERVVYIGDALWDVETTRNMGLDFVGVRLSGDFEVLLDSGAEVVIPDFQDYRQFIAALQKAKPPKISML